MIAIDQVLRWPLLPLLLAQALWVRHMAKKLPEAAGPREGVTGSGPSLRLLILGDSSGAGVGAGDQREALSGQLVARLAQDYRVTWKLLARTGHTTRDALAMLTDHPADPFDLVVTALGVNDVTKVTTAKRWRQGQARILDTLVTRHKAQQVLFSGVPPLGQFPLLPQPLRWVLGGQARRLDQILAELAEASSVATHVPFEMPLTREMMAEDGYHPSPKAYALWAEMLVMQVNRQRVAG